MALQNGIRIEQYLDDWLVRARSHQVCLQHTPGLVEICQNLCWLVIMEKSELDPKQVFDFVAYSSTTSVAGKLLELVSPSACLVIQIPDRSANSHRETSSLWPTSYETHTVASQTELEGTRITRKGDPCAQVPSSPSKMVAEGKQCASGSTITSTKTCSSNLYRHIKRRMGCSLK